MRLILDNILLVFSVFYISKSTVKVVDYFQFKLRHFHCKRDLGIDLVCCLVCDIHSVRLGCF